MASDDSNSGDELEEARGVEEEENAIEDGSLDLGFVISSNSSVRLRHDSDENLANGTHDATRDDQIQRADS